MLLIIIAFIWWLAYAAVPFIFIFKDYRLIEAGFDRAVGHGMRTLKTVLFTLSLGVLPLTLLIYVFVSTGVEIQFEMEDLANIIIVAVILACALTEAILLNRGKEKHRVLPWVLAAVNLASALLYWLLRTEIFKAKDVFRDWVYSCYYTRPYPAWLLLSDAPAIAMLIAAIQFVLLAKQLFFVVCFKTGKGIIPIHLIMIGANLLSAGVALILPCLIRDPKVYTITCFVLLFVLNAGAIAASIKLYVYDGYKTRK